MKKVMIKNFETGEVFYTDTEHLYPKAKGTISESQRAAADLMKIAEQLDELAMQLYKLGGSEGVDDKLGGNLEAKAEMLSVISSDLLKVID
ncbi:MAG: hypothetical protein K5764_01575 [Prevotella sp.]|nr:hypothetical protein [Prevotella sp.]